jgi:hypothetical protein
LSGPYCFLPMGTRDCSLECVRKQERIEASGLAPLDYMLAVMRDEDAEAWRRDEMAKAAAPYVHPRLAAIATGGDVNTNIASA